MSAPSPTWLRGNLGLVVLCLALQLAVGLLAGRLYASAMNSLANNGRWTSTKTTLEKGVIGAYQYVLRLQALEKGSLDLGAWHGFQEVLYRTSLQPRSLEFSARLEEEATLSVIFAKTDRGFAGVRLSRHARFPGLFFRASDEGEFLEKRRLSRADLPDDAWHRVQLGFGAAGLVVRVDGQPAGHFEGFVAAAGRLGFRGGLHPAFVDDVRVRSAEGGGFREDFDGPAGAGTVTAFLVAAVALSSWATFLLLRLRRGRTPRQLGLGMLMILLVAVAIELMLLRFQTLQSRLYPYTDADLRRQEVYETWARTEEIKAEIQLRYAGPPAPGVRRILFVGTSQTWGAGAFSERDGYVARVEAALNGTAPPGTRFECINAGIPATLSGPLADLLETQWLGLEPEVVVIDLSNNDRATPLAQFEVNLRRILKLVRGRGALSLLVLEPNSTDRPPALLAMRHGVMRRIGAAFGVPVVDLQSLLAVQADTGFLWWDFVHPTSYGHRLIADGLVGELSALLR